MPNRHKVRKLADRLLSMGAVNSPPVPVWELAKLTGVTVKRGELPEDLSGFLVRDKQSIVIGVNSNHSETRQRFTLAHELGHLLLHPQASYVDRSFPIFFRDERSSKAEVRAEIEANQFAADLLMPMQMLMLTSVGRTPVDMDDESQIKKLAQRFQVSPQAMIFRLMNLGLAEPTQETSGAGGQRKR